MKSIFRILSALALLLAERALAGPLPTNGILFVTQIPIAAEVNSRTVSSSFCSVVSVFVNHQSDTAFAGRGGDLYLRYGNGIITNLTRGAGYGVTGSQATNGIAVRDPSVHWSGTKALFSMVVGAPRFPGDSNVWFWQLYEVTNLAFGQSPVIAKVQNQPTNYNNVTPTYGTDERIIFASDRPRDGSPHLYPQREEYLDLPTVTGLWSLDPATGDLFLMNHAPSGAFNPFVDSAGRVIFIRWDHLSRDPNATDDTLGLATNGLFNYTDESAGALVLTNVRTEFFPEPRNFDTNALAGTNLRGNSFNQFFPWQINEDGTGEEIVNHVGRHELLAPSAVLNAITNDPNVISLSALTNRFNTNFFNFFLQVREDPVNPGTLVGTDSIELGTHAAGQLLSINAGTNVNPELMAITYLTPKVTAQPTNGLSSGATAGHTGLYRNPLPMSDGTFVAAHTDTKSLDVNPGTPTHPGSLYDFRIKTLQKVGFFWQPDTLLTPGYTSNVTYYNGNLTVAYTGALWEIEPAEVYAHQIPARRSGKLAAVEQQVFDEEGVDVSVLQAYMRSNDLGLIIGRNVTTRDDADKQQPYNLRIAGTTNQTLGVTNGTIYEIGYLQLIQADQIRGLFMGGATPVPGRRVIATPMHDAVSNNLPNINGPAGGIRLGDDGSHAAFMPARRAMTWQLTDTNGGSVVKERYWITVQPGEIRTCTSCHGLNTSDQAGHSAPTNEPEALRSLLRYWKTQTRYSKVTSGTIISNGLVQLQLSGAPYRTNTVYASPDLIQWAPIGTNDTTTNGLFQISDPGSTGFPVRFYHSAAE